jgi:uroporphyrinogen decarboxylase
MSATKPLLRALAGNASERPPFWLMRQAGRYLPEYRALREQAGSFLTLCLTPGLAAEATLQPIRRFGMDAAILFADILIVPYALGQEVSFREGEGPVLSPIRDRDGVAVLDRGDFLARVAPIAETVRLVAAGLPPEIALIGFAGAPWTVATYMVEGGTSRDFAAVKRFAFGDPAGFDRLIDRLVEATAAYLGLQIEAGAEVVQLFDSWAGVLPEGAFRRWVIGPTRRLVTALNERYPAVPVIGFPRGAGLSYETYFRATGVDALSLDPSVPLAFIRERLQPLGPVQGNLDPVLLTLGGAPMAAGVSEILAALGDGPLIFNLGHGVVPETPPAHVAALAAQLRAG